MENKTTLYRDTDLGGSGGEMSPLEIEAEAYAASKWTRVVLKDVARIAYLAASNKYLKLIEELKKENEELKLGNKYLGGMLDDIFNERKKGKTMKTIEQQAEAMILDIFEGFPPTAFFREDLIKFTAKIIAGSKATESAGVEEIVKKEKIKLIWEMIEGWQDARDRDIDINTEQFSAQDIEVDLYEWLEKVDPKTPGQSPSPSPSLLQQENERGLYVSPGERKFTETEIGSLQSQVHKITGDGEVMKLFNKLLGVAEG